MVHMVEQELSTYMEIIEKLKKIVSAVLKTGDWTHSIFLKVTAAKLQKIYDKAGQLSNLKRQPQVTQHVKEKKDIRAIPPGHFQVFILLYQVDGTNLVGWYRNIKMLAEYSSITRSAYRDEISVKELIHSKSSNIERSGYIVVNIKEDDIRSTDQVSLDVLGHKLYTLKDKAIKLKNIVEFVHADKNHYEIGSDRLILIDKNV